MRAAVLTGPETFELADVPRPEPGAGEVRIKLEGCGVCASNLTPWEGPDWMHFPTEPGGLGHEGWGRVEALGKGVAGLAEGQRVAALAGRSYAEYDVSNASALVTLPASLDNKPLPAEPLGCAMNIFRRSGIEAGQTVAIVGIGFLGAVLTRLAALAGARVIAVSRRPFALALARTLGADEALPIADREAVIGSVREATGGRMCNRVIEAVGKQGPLDLAAELTGEGARLIIAGYHQDGPRQVNMQLWNWRGFDVVNAHERDPRVSLRGMREGVAAVVEGRIDLDPLLTHRFPLARLNDALAATRDRPDGFLKAVVTVP